MIDPDATNESQKEAKTMSNPKQPLPVGTPIRYRILGMTFVGYVGPIGPTGNGASVPVFKSEHDAKTAKPGRGGTEVLVAEVEPLDFNPRRRQAIPVMRARRGSK